MIDTGISYLTSVRESEVEKSREGSMLSCSSERDRDLKEVNLPRMRTAY